MCSWFFNADILSQALLASDYSQGNYDLARQVTYKVLQVWNYASQLSMYYFLEILSMRYLYRSMRMITLFDVLFLHEFNQIGLIMGVTLAVILFLGFGALSSLFSTDSEVLGIARSGTLVRI